MFSVCLTTKPVGEPDAGNPHVRFDERGWETERCRMAQATALILDSTGRAVAASYSVSPQFEVKRLCVGRNQTVSECTCHRLVRIHTNRPCNFRTSRK